MATSSRSSIVVPSSDQVDSTWQLVHVEKLGRRGKKQSPTMAQAPSLQHRRGRTEGNRRLSMFKMRSRSHTTSTTSMGHGLSPSVSVESQQSHHTPTEGERPESCWSDSDNSDRRTKSWVAKGSRLLKKQNSKFSLSSSKRSTWVEESDEASEPYPELLARGYNKHDRMGSASDDHPLRPTISKPYNFEHITHTQAHQFAHLRSTSKHRLISEFSAISGSQTPRRELRGIPVEDVKSPLSGSFASAYRDPVTPPALSPRKYRTSHANSTLSIRTPVLSRSQSVDNFSQPSPGIYRGPRSPGSPPARTSSRNATHPAPDFFSEVHHATPQERELLSQCIEPAIVPAPTHTQPGHVIDHNLPHAITTADEIALTLKPSTTRSTLTLADVPEEDELRSVKRVSEETPRPVTADPTLRHAMSFPSNGCSPCRRSVSASRKSLRQSGMMPVGRFTVQDPDAPSENAHAPAAAPRYRRSRGMSTGVNGIDACWEDDIDYCYQHEAEADCDFDWDRVSMDNTPTMNGSHNVRPLVDTHRDSAESLSKTYEKLELPDEVNGLAATATAYKPGCHHLPRLQTSLPDLDFSAASSAKSSMASLRGPVTPSQQLPSPKKIRPILQLSKSTDTFNLDSYFAAHEGDLPWSQDESFQKAPSWDHAMNFNYPFNNLSLPGCSSRTSLRSNRPPLSTHHSSENVVLPHSSSRAHTRHNTNSSGSFPELVCSQNYREQASIVAEQIADRIAALQVTHANDAVASPKSHATQTKTTASHSILKETASASKSHSLDGEELTEESITSTGPKGPSVSVATFASKLRSNSTASSASGSSSMRASRVSYSLFPSVPSARS